MRAPPEMLHEVITNTIYLDNAINEIISIYFHAYNFKEDEEGKSSTLEPVERFHRLFLQELGFSSKLKIIREIAEPYKDKIVFPKDFDEKFRRFYLIRNIFAHSLYAKHVGSKEMPHKAPSNAKWDDLYKEHKEAFGELNDFLMKKVYDIVLKDELGIW